MTTILTPFMYLAGLGLILSLIVHISALLGRASPFGEITWALHLGIFVVWFPAVIAARTMVRGFRQEEFWKAALRACPGWMKYVSLFFFLYALLNFIIFIAKDIQGSNSDVNDLRGFSGHWMAFYSAAMAMLYSAIHVKQHDETRRCPNGHRVSPATRFCEECGAEIIESQSLE